MTVVTADAIDATTSNVAAAVWFPTRVGPRDRVLAWGGRTREALEALARDHPEAGVLDRRTLLLYREPPGRPWWAAAVGPVTDASRDELPAGYAHGLVVTVPLAEMPVHLRWLADRVTAAGGVVLRRRLTRLVEATDLADVVVNAAGLGARELVDDATVVPIRGQVVRTTNPGLTTSVRDEHHPDGYTYVHPRRDDCILGGTVEDGIEDLAPDPDTADAILDRCRRLVPALADAEVLAHAVGLRPGRPEVRLEVDLDVVPGATVVHDYGHGGAGFTLGWGCADEVASLVDQVG